MLLVEPQLPWTHSDKPLARFRKMVEAMFDEVGKTESNPSLEATFDNYLQTIWKVSLAAPLDYVGSHPFDLTPKSFMQFYSLSNERRGQAHELSLKQTETIRKQLHYKSPDRVKGDKFEITIDGVQLRRPVRFSDLPTSSNVIQSPLLFVGSYNPSLAGIPSELSGGPLHFEAYLLWSSVIVPKEHRGAMIRIGDASGTLFDSTFMGYQVSEQTRLRQLSCEIFVLEGLDAAINIDRESFNYSHPHYQIVVKWLHGAIKQFTNKHKELGKQLREARLAIAAASQSNELERAILTKLEALGIKHPTEVVLVDDNHSVAVEKLRKKGTIVFSRSILDSTFAKGSRAGKLIQRKAALLEQKVSGAIQLLDAWGLLDEIPYDEQQRLLKDLIDIFTFDSKDE